MTENENIDELEYILWQKEKQQRLRVALAILPAIIGIIILMTSSDISRYFFVNEFLIKILGPSLLMISALFALMIYLQTGFKKNPDQYMFIRHEQELTNLKKSLSNENKNNSIINELKSDIKSIKEQYNKSMSNILENDQKNELINEMKSNLLATVKSEANTDILNEIKESIAKSNNIKEVENVYLRTLDRLNTEIESQTRRGSLNLSLGIVTTLIGLFMLGYFVIELNKTITTPFDSINFFVQFIPRLSLVMLIEVFAYFFLRLYKSSLSEIKYFQNEMTTTESKLVAIKSAMLINELSTITSVISEIIKVDRNSILEKGQTTVEIEKFRMENKSITNIVDKLSSTFKSEQKT